MPDPDFGASHMDRQLRLYGDNPTLIWGMKNAERARRLFVKQDVANQLGPDALIWVNLAFAFDPQWLRHIVAHPGLVVTLSGVPVIAHVRNAAALAPDMMPEGTTQLEYEDGPQIYNHDLRKVETPFIDRLNPDTVRGIERQSYFGAYKGVTDLLTKYLWPELALVLTRGAARIGMSPNQVTAIGGAMCLLATVCFWYGHFWAGVLAGFTFMVLDTVDGKLARCTITSSPWGNVFDHGIDLVHPPFWWWAWAVGLERWGLGLSREHFVLVMIAVVGGYVAQRLIEGASIKRFGIELHVWQRFDSRFRLITARRNPNMVILVASLLANRPDWGLIGVAGWTIVSLVVHAVRLIQAWFAFRRSGALTSWLRAET